MVCDSRASAFYLFISLFILIHGEDHEIVFPDFIDRCEVRDPNMDSCLQNAIAKALPFLAQGIPQLGLKPLDPLRTPLVEMTQSSGAVKFNLTLRDIITTGYSNLQVTKARANITNNQIELEAIFPLVKIDTNYNATAEVLLFPMHGSGAASFIMENITGSLIIKGKRQLKFGNEFLRIKNVLVNIQLEKLQVDFLDLFNGDTYLGAAANAFLNQFSFQIFRGIKPLLEETMGKIITDIAQPFFNIVPMKHIFL